MTHSSQYGLPADCYRALVRDDVPSLQHSETGAGLSAAPQAVHAAASQEGAPHGVGASRHVCSPRGEGA